MSVQVKTGVFYRSYDGELWCCFKTDSRKPEHCRASCVRASDGRVEHFYMDGRYDAEGKREHTLVDEVFEYKVATLNDLRDRVHNLAIEKGWHQDRDISNPHVLGSMLALIHSEVSEALEEVRNANRLGAFAPNVFDGKGKPIGLPSELADIIIRTLDLCGALGIDIEQAVEAKHAYNCTRSHRHGGKAL